MFRQWLALVIIVLVYIPVAIDATVLHVAAPTLSMTLGASGNELLWIIDIYSLVMAGMVLPMGALGDRIGFKRLLMIGSVLFGLSSLAAAFAPSAGWLIAARASLAIGAAMIIPATLAGIRTLFTDARHRNIALGVWAAVGSGGAAFGPLIGGMLLEHFYWGSVFLINVPIVLIVVSLAARFVPAQQGRPEQPLNISHAIMLIVAILLLVYSAKTALKGVLSPWMVACTLLTGAVMLFIFVRIQLRARVPMIDMRLFCHRIILSGVVMAMTAMIALVGFELLMAQELQFVHGFTPFEAGIFMLPVMVASGFSGPIAGVLVGRLGLRIVAAGGMGLSGQFYRPVDARFQHPTVAGVEPDGAAGLQCRQRTAGIDVSDHGCGAERESGRRRRDRNHVLRAGCWSGYRHFRSAVNPQLFGVYCTATGAERVADR